MTGTPKQKRSVGQPRPVGQKEIAELAGVSPDTVKKWRERHEDFPAPLWTVGGGPAWDLLFVNAWLMKTGRWREIARNKLVAAGVDPARIAFREGTAAERPGPPLSDLATAAYMNVNGWAVRLWDIGPDRWDIVPPSMSSHTGFADFLDTAAAVKVLSTPPGFISGLRLNDGRITTNDGRALTEEEWSQHIGAKRGT